MPKPPTCACGCGMQLQRKGRTGPLPSYVNASHRKRAWRQRLKAPDVRSVPNPDLPPIHLGPNRPHVEQVQQALLELRAIGFAFDRLGATVRPELAWRCARLGVAISEAIAENFGEEATR